MRDLSPWYGLFMTYERPTYTVPYSYSTATAGDALSHRGASVHGLGHEEEGELCGGDGACGQAAQGGKATQRQGKEAKQRKKQEQTIVVKFHHPQKGSASCLA